MPPGPGPNYKKVNKEVFETLCKVHATTEEACGVLGLDDNTLNSWCRRHYGSVYSEVRKRFEGHTKVSARRKLIEQWQGGNLTALIFYLKNHCGMADNVELTHGFDQARPAVVKYVWNAKGDRPDDLETGRFDDLYDQKTN